MATQNASVSRNGDGQAASEGLGGKDAQRVIASLQSELQTLIAQRVSITRRMALIRQVVTGLANFVYRGSESNLGSPLFPKQAREHDSLRGLTAECRQLLTRSSKALTLREIVQEIQTQTPLILAHHKQPMTSVRTVLGRLVVYRQATEVLTEEGRLAWRGAQVDSSATAPSATDVRFR